MRLFHPRTRRLQGWLDGGESELDKHLAECTVCARRLEGLLGEPASRSPQA